MFSCLAGSVQTQTIDTLAFQNFELTPHPLNWAYTGTPNGFQSGNSSASATPANSPLGINSSRAWHLVQVSGGNQATFNNQIITGTYDSIRVRFRLAAMNLNGSSGGPDNLDYVLVAYSTNNGASFSNRIRVRGAVNNNCSWPYSAASTAKAYYLPATEQVFQPTNSGLQLQDGLGTVELVFPGNIGQVMVRITPRSSSSTDHWLIDNLVLTGESNCIPSTTTISASACDSYLSPSGNHTWTSTGTYQDTIQSASNCDSLITINLSVTNSTTSSLTESTCGPYTSPSGNFTWTTSGVYQDTIPNTANCDSLITINLTVGTSSSSTITESVCDQYTSPSGNYTWTMSGTYQDTIPNAANCDSLITINLSINTADTSVFVAGSSLVASMFGGNFEWIDCANGNQLIPGETQQSFSPTVTGSYAVIVTANGCTDTSSCYTVTVVGIDPALASDVRIWPNPTENRLHLDMGQMIHKGQVAIYDLQGRKVFEQAFRQAESIEMNTSSLAPGVYFLEMESEGIPKRIRFVKE